MKVGDLVTVGPAKTGVYLIVEDHILMKDHFNMSINRGGHECVLLYSAEHGVYPMGKEFLYPVSDIIPEQHSSME